MKSAVVIAIVILLALAIVGSAAGAIAQSDPESVPTDGENMTAPPCQQPEDMPPDQVGDGDASPSCTPTPVPSDTPTVMPTDTPTPPPAVATVAPTPTPGSKDVPPGTLSGQLPFANPGEDRCDLDLTLTAKQSCNQQTFPALFTINFLPFSSGVPITVQVDSGTSSDTSRQTWDFLSVPGGPGPGTYTITASEKRTGTPVSAKLSLTVQQANTPQVLVYPRVILPGGSGKIYLAGFPANAVVPLGLYRQKQDCDTFGQGNGCYELSRDLGTVKTDGNGTAIQAFSVPPNEKRIAYLTAWPSLQIDKKDAFGSLKAVGRPWFNVVGPSS